MGNTVLGVVAPLPQGEWNSTTTYQKLSVVREGNSSYIAKSANVNIQPGVTDSWETYWMLLNEDGDRGQPGQQGETGVGVPDGGLKGDLLVKRSQANYDDEWVDPDNITVGNATKAVQDENGNNIADTYQTKQDSTTQNTALQTQITSNTQGITQNSQFISRNSARLTNLEQRISPSPFVTDSTVAYVKDVPANALPYAELQKLGGMTRKCTNLLNMSKFSGGGKVINADGSVSITSGSSAIYPSAILTGVLPSGTYNLTNISGNSCYVMSSTSDYSNLVGIGQNKSFTYDGSSYLEIRYLEQAANTTVTYTAMLNTGSAALPYEPYFEGLRSAPVTSVESVGANLWSATWELGEIDTNGKEYDSTGKLKSGFVKISYGETYTIHRSNSSGFISMRIYDKDKKFLGTGSGGYYELLRGYSVGNPMTNNQYSCVIKITNAVVGYIRVIADYTDTTTQYSMYRGNYTDKTMPAYTPYTKSTLPIPEAVLPANGINDTVYDFIEWDGEKNTVTKTKAVEITDLGAKTWYFSSDGNSYAYALGQGKYKNSSPMVANLPSEFTSIICDNAGNIVVRFITGAFTTSEEVKAAMSGVYAAVALATPEVTDISALITADNLLPVQGNGTITFVNEYGYAVPSTVEYMT